MSKIIEIQNTNHLGDSIINFIFFNKIKDYIESNNITIHYFAREKYHENIKDFNCSKNIKIIPWTPETNKEIHIMWQARSRHAFYIEDKLCNMFNIFTKKFEIPIEVKIFEYEDKNLFERFEKLDDIYKNVDILMVNSKPLSGQIKYDKDEWDTFAIKLSKKYKIATTQEVNDENVISLSEFSLKNIAAVALKVKTIIAIDTGPSIPLYNKDILDNVENFYIFGKSQHKTRKFIMTKSLNDLNFLL
jgi:hypothetical protein